MRRLLIKLKAYIWPQWRVLTCPYCGLVVRARSGPHMTDAVGRHMRRCHPDRRAVEDVLIRFIAG